MACRIPPPRAPVGAPTPAPTPTPTPEPTPAPTPETTELTATVTKDSTWTGGLCRSFKIANSGGKSSTNWKLIFTPFQVDSLAWDLFQVSEDPEEKINLYAADRPEVAVLKAHLAAWMARQDPEELSAGREISEEDRERLRNLGYLD